MLFNFSFKFKPVHNQKDFSIKFTNKKKCSVQCKINTDCSIQSIIKKRLRRLIIKIIQYSSQLLNMFNTIQNYSSYSFTSEKILFNSVSQ